MANGVHPANRVARVGRGACPATVGRGRAAGQERARLPLCVDCLALLLDEPAAFWEGLCRGTAGCPPAGRP